MTAVTDSHTVLWIPRYWPAVGGTEFHSHELALHLSRSQRVTVLAHCAKTESSQQPLQVSAALSDFSDITSGGVRNVKLAPKKTYVKALSVLGRYHGKNKIVRKLFQVVFNQAYGQVATPFLNDADRIHFIYNGLTEAAVLAAHHAANLNIPFIFTPNVLDTSEQGSDWDSTSFHWLYEKADLLIALTEHEAQWLVGHGVSSDKISVVPYGPILKPREPAHEQGRIAELLSSRYILFLGRLVPGKGSNLLLSAFEQLSENDAETQLIMVGPAEDHTSAIIEDVNGRLNSQRVHLLQDVSQPLKTALLEEAAVLCVPSNRESLGGVYIEAMASGTPVIALDRPVSRCVIQHGKEGLLVTEDINSIVDGLRTVIDNPQLARQMGCSGSAKVAMQYAWHLVTESILGVYATLDSRPSVELKKAA